MKNKKNIPITFEQAYNCVEINGEQKVHSFTVWMAGLFEGADLGLEKVRSVLESAANENELFLSDKMDSTDHNIAAFDRQNEEWLYFNCDSEKVTQLKQSLGRL